MSQNGQPCDKIDTIVLQIDLVRRRVDVLYRQERTSDQPGKQRQINPFQSVDSQQFEVAIIDRRLIESWVCVSRLGASVTAYHASTAEASTHGISQRSAPTPRRPTDRDEMNVRRTNHTFRSTRKQSVIRHMTAQEVKHTQLYYQPPGHRMESRDIGSAV